MSNLSDDELMEVAQRVAAPIIDRVDALVKSMTLDELQAARSILNDQIHGEKYADSKPVEPLAIDEERAEAMSSTFSDEQSSDVEAVELDRDRWGNGKVRRKLFEKIKSLSNSGDARKIASAQILRKTYDRIKGAMEADITAECSGFPGCGVDHNEIDDDVLARHTMTSDEYEVYRARRVQQDGGQ